ncbi:MAG TPA: type III pantothenate kinase, partial [Alphaproteobacteria bacterium]|nr:type III pantothenate kinase [Alphaproteobacteria bacterium]
MLLAIDAGNTNIVFALFDGSKPVGVWRSSTNAQHTADEYAVFLHTLMQQAGLGKEKITSAIMASVVPVANFPLMKLCRDHFKCEPMIVGAHGVDAGIKVLLDKPEEIGADRIVNAVGGTKSYKGPLLII